MRRALRKHQQVRLLSQVREMRQVRSLLRRTLRKRLQEIGLRKSRSGSRNSKSRTRRSQPQTSPFTQEDLRIPGQVHYWTGT